MEKRLTLPIETGLDQEIFALIDRLKADAVRDSDGTDLPEWVSDTLTKVYSTYFPSRGDEEWADASAGERVSQYLMSEPVTAPNTDPLVFNVMEGYLPAQFRPNLECDLSKYWQVIDRTTGRTLDGAEWSVEAAKPLPLDHPVTKVGEPNEEAGSAVVTIHAPEAFHQYTVSFLAWQVWDSTQIYNYLTNDWADDPTRVKERPYDVAYARTWERTKRALAAWLKENPHVDVVRFTTFFYHFTLVFDNRGREKYVDWFGYSAAVSVPALEDFERRYGYALTPEDFVDGGHYNNPFRTPRKPFLDWVEYTSQVVAEKAGVLVKQVHDEGREAIMFYGDNLIGVEPYGPYFESIDLDGIVGSVGSAATCRMIADVPHVRYTEGRFLPYFFPDVFNDEGDPVGEANESWVTSRRAIVRNPLDRIGYGGYLSLAMKYPRFIDRIEQIINEFRSLHERTGSRRPENYKVKVGVLNAWGKLRTWQTHMVAHALWYKQIYSYLGVIEALAGLPFEVEFISFDDVTKEGKVPEDIDVLINAGARDTAFSGGDAWADAALQEAVRKFVYEGGGLIGIGEPSARTIAEGPLLTLSDLFGVDKEVGWTLGHTRHPLTQVDHFIAPGGLEDYDFGEDPGDMVATRNDVEVLDISDGSIRAAVSQVGEGRTVYLAGLPYTTANARLLARAILWAAGAEDQWESLPVANDHRVEVGFYPEAGQAFIYNSSMDPVSTWVTGGGVEERVHLQPMQGIWLDLEA